MTTFKMPEPAKGYSSANPNLYTAEALRDVLEQAANICSKRGNILSTNPDIYRDAQECAKEIRAMKELIK
jgi:FtsZ-interacting cell division protein YlmF